MVRLKKSAKAKKASTKSTNKKTKINKRNLKTQRKNSKTKRNLSTGSSAKRKFYTIKEDALILQKLSNMGKKSKSEVLNELVKELNRSYESLRDRIKRYIGRLSSNSKREVLKQSKTSKDLYLHLAPVKGAYRDIISINEMEPSVLNIKNYNKKQKKK